MAARGRGNNGNLKPPRSTDEARRRGAVGGRKSGEARRQKKTLAQKIEVMLNRRVTNPKIKKQLCEDFAKDAKTYEDAIIAAQIYQAVKGNTKAFNTLVSLLPKEDNPVDAANADETYSVNILIDALKNRKIKGVDDMGDNE